MCKACDKEMLKCEVHRNGLRVRAVQCPECKDTIIHPEDKIAIQQYSDIKGKNYVVKLRVVGNSHAISIPKEIVDFFEASHNQMNRDMDRMVRLCIEDMQRLSLVFDNGREDGR